MIAETTGARTDLRKVSFRDKKLLIVENQERNLTTLIVCDTDSFILQTAARHFTEKFYSRYKPSIDEFDGAVSVFNDAKDLVERVFPFVPPEEIIMD